MLQWEHSAILSTFMKLPFVIEIFVLSIFEWPLKTGFTVVCVAEKAGLSLTSGEFFCLGPYNRGIKITSFFYLHESMHLINTTFNIFKEKMEKKAFNLLLLTKHLSGQEITSIQTYPKHKFS